jgi:phosphatidylserine/phosphatidylglycerophosphate/cardiolipin synthase-like enzyme
MTQLNYSLIESDGGKGQRLLDYGCSDEAQVEVVFRNLSARLIAEIDVADYVFGSIAWLTHEGILGAMAKKKGVSIVVQKEDFLRPDGREPSAGLRAQYAALPGTLRYQFDGTIQRLAYHADPTLEAVRCVGNLNSTKSPSHPRAHNKFAVYAKATAHKEAPWELTSVWTGSFNFTNNAARSLENAVLMRSEKIVRAFYDEFQQIVALSEPLDWETPWSAPQWSIGPGT